jgi:hypothetical protein
MTASHRPRWYQFRLGSLLTVMFLVALAARPAWQELGRWQARGGWDYWRLFRQEVSHEQRQQAAVQRGLEWLQTHQGAADWNAPPHVGQSQESDL